MTYTGVVKGKTIALAEWLPYPEGQPVIIAVEPCVAQLLPGSPAASRQAMHASPHLQRAAVDALERAITAGQLPVHQAGVFDTAR